MLRRKLAVFEEQAESAAGLVLNLRALGYEVQVLECTRALDGATIEEAGLLVFVLSENAGSGLNALSQLRTLSYYPPLAVFIKDATPARVTMLLECGCDCVIGGTDDMVLVKAWFESLLRRGEMYVKLQEKRESVIRVGDLEIDVSARMVRTKTKRSELTEREMRLLLELAQKPGAVCRRADLLSSVWGASSESLTGTLNTYINRLRMKIEDEFRTPKYLIGVYGVGYRLTTGEVAADSPGFSQLDRAAPVTAFPHRPDADQDAVRGSARKRQRIQPAS